MELKKCTCNLPEIIGDCAYGTNDGKCILSGVCNYELAPKLWSHTRPVCKGTVTVEKPEPVKKNNDPDLTEFLEGNEGVVLYSPIFGECTFVEAYTAANGWKLIKVSVSSTCETKTFTVTGRLNYNVEKTGECMLWPSKDCRDWKQWWETKNPVKKTWEGLISNPNKYIFDTDGNIDGSKKKDWCVDLTGNRLKGWSRNETKFERSALAMLKISAIIETFYGGVVNPANGGEFWNITYDCHDKKFIIMNYNNVMFNNFQCLNFKSYEMAKEFLSYSENVRLAEDYYML